jgi:signal peptidase II
VSVALPVWVADFVTKRLAVAGLQPAHMPHQVLGNTVRLTLAYNQQGVMGLPAGPYGRWILSGVSIVLLGVLIRLLQTARAHQRLRATALALIIGGACGNLLNRLGSARGVVDFIDLGYGTWRFWTFNVADVAIDVGVALFAWTQWRAGRRAPSAAPPGEVGA